MPRFGRVVLGGTFDRLHVGHEALVRTAFRIGRTVAIGLTTDAYLAAHPKPQPTAVASAAARRRALERWLSSRYPARRWSIVPIYDRFGGAVEPGVDALVVSVETVEGGRAVNRERVRRGNGRIPLVTVPLVLGDDLEPVSSRRIRAGEIDREGHRTAPLAVGVEAAAPDVDAVRRAIRAAFPKVRLHRTTPTGLRAAGALARAAERLQQERDLGIAVARRAGGWTVALRGPHVGLVPFAIAGRTPAALERALLRSLRRR